MEPHPPFLLLLTLFSLLLASTAVTTSLSSPPTAISPTKPPATNTTTPISPTKPPSTNTTTTPISPTKPPSTNTTHPISPTKPPSSPTPSPLSSSTLDPKQLRALQSLNIPTSKDPCSLPSAATTTCDASKPFRHLLSLRLTNCSDDLEISTTALKSLSTLTTLAFLNCPVPPTRLPSQLASNLRSFTCINSLRKLTGVWLSRLQNLTDLTVSGVTVNASGPAVILGGLKFLHSLTISHANLTGYLPKHWHLNITHIDLSDNHLKGKIPTSLTLLENLEHLNLSSNSLYGEVPTSIGDLLALQNLSLASNSLSGPIPDSMAAMPALSHLNLGSNNLNGTIPKFISEMKGLKYLNLEKNSFHGVMPFNGSFIKRLIVFKIGGNTDLCYNHSTLSPKVKLGIAPCDKHGLPISPPPGKGSSAESNSEGDRSDDDDDGGDDDSDHKEQRHHGPSKVVLGVAIGLSSIVFLIVFLVLLSKWCG